MSSVDYMLNGQKKVTAVLMYGTDYYDSYPSFYKKLLFDYNPGRTYPQDFFDLFYTCINNDQNKTEENLQISNYPQLR
jgi:hypothetical protein